MKTLQRDITKLIQRNRTPAIVAYILDEDGSADCIVAGTHANAVEIARRLARRMDRESRAVDERLHQDHAALDHVGPETLSDLLDELAFTVGDLTTAPVESDPMTNEAQVKKAELRFAAEYGDGSALWARLQKLAAAIGYRVELEEPAEPITYDTRVEFHRLLGCPQLLPHDPYYGMRILAAVAMANRRATEQTHLTGSTGRSNAAKRARSNTSLG